jgi:hypothetical protein
MCAAYSPPIEDITQFNSSLFNQTSTGLTQTETDLLYLSKKKSDISTASLTTFNNAVTIGGNVTLGQTTITDGQNLNARLILSSNTGVSTTHSLFTNMGTSSVLTIGSSSSSISTYGSLTSIGPLNMKANSNCEQTFSADNIAVRITAGNKILWTNATAAATLKIGNILAPLTIDASTIAISGTTTFSSGVTCNNGLTANVVTATEFETSIPTNITKICNSTSSGTIRLGAGLDSLGTLEIGSNTGNNKIKGPTVFSQNTTFQNTGTTTFNGVLVINENATFATLKTTTFNGTTIFNGANTFNTGDTSFPARMILRGGQYANEVLEISGVGTTYVFGSMPIHQRINIKSTINVNITLPTISSSTNAGLEFTFIKTGSITNSITFTRGGTNLIYSSSTITNVSPYTTLVNTQTTIVFIILEVSAGVFVWKEIV